MENNEKNGYLKIILSGFACFIAGAILHSAFWGGSAEANITAMQKQIESHLVWSNSRNEKLNEVDARTQVISERLNEVISQLKENKEELKGIREELKRGRR